MADVLTFGVDPKLATLLGSSYRSTEQAIKELVDNAWDADATEVRISLPEEMSAESISIADNGSGMTVEELRHEYLKVARDRRSVKGEFTVGFRRRVKGRKGIGKFAGLMVADQMELITSARGVQANLLFERERLVQAQSDFERVEIPLTSGACDTEAHGTTIVLRDLNRRLAHPNADKLRRVLVADYGRNDDFNIFVNDQLVSVRDVPGEYFSYEKPLSTAGDVKLSFSIAEDKQGVKGSGIVVKVNGKPVGSPTYFGLDEREDVPQHLLKRVYGEVEADGLVDDVTADWGYVIENSHAYRELEEYVQIAVREDLERTFRREFKALHTRINQQIEKRLSSLPEHKRGFARAALERVINKFYGDSEDRIQAVVSVVLDALERDEYWEVIKAVHASEQRDIQTFADALMAFGLLEIVLIGRQARSRLEILNSLDKLIANNATREMQVHRAIEYNLWILGAKYALMSSNQTLRNVIESYGSEKYSGDNATKRPDLLLLSSLDGRHLLIEFKRPSKQIDRDDEAQAQRYRDELATKFSAPIDIVLVGGTVDPALRRHPGMNVEYYSYVDLCARARAEITWLLNGMTERTVTLNIQV
jgi:hypothetical protein